MKRKWAFAFGMILVVRGLRLNVGVVDFIICAYALNILKICRILWCSRCEIIFLGFMYLLLHQSYSLLVKFLSVELTTKPCTQAYDKVSSSPWMDGFQKGSADMPSVAEL